MKKLTGYFFQGLLFLAPISITSYVIYLAFDFSDNLLQKELTILIGRPVPGMGVLIMLIFLTALGYVGQTIIAKPFKVFFHKLIHTIPLLELIYSAIKDFFSAFVGKDKKFNKPVMFKINPSDNTFRIGFITNNHLDAFGVSDMVAVYVPFSYTFTGETYLVSVDAISYINAPASEVMKFIVAGGVADIYSNEKDPSTSHKI